MIRPALEDNPDVVRIVGGDGPRIKQQLFPQMLGRVPVRRLLERYPDRVEFEATLPAGANNLCVSLVPMASQVALDGEPTINMGGPIGSFAIPDGVNVAGHHRGTIDFIEFRIDNDDLPALLADHDLVPTTGQAKPGYVAADSLLERRLHQLRFALDHAPRLDALYLDMTLEACLGQLLRRHVDASFQIRRRRPSLTPAALRRVADFIDANIDQTLRLEELAQVAGVTRAHFARAFRNDTGFTPHRYVMLRRVDAALQMLRRGGMSIAEVASLSGFADNAHLSRIFRTMLGVGPSEARRMIEGAKEVAMAGRGF